MEFNLNPVAFTLFGIQVMWYGILIALGLLAGAFVASKELQRRGFDDEILWDVLMWAVPMSIIGARLYYVAFQWQYYSQYPGQIFNIRGGGMAIHGGLLAAFLTAYIFSRRRKVSVLVLFDVTAPGIVLGQAIGRWGNFVNQEAHGGPTDLPWGILIDGQIVHPTFLYESLGDFAIMLFLLWYARNKQKHDGQIICYYILLYGVLRFFVEGLRTDSLMLGSFRIAQLMSLGGVILGIIGLYTLKKKDTPLSRGTFENN